MVLELGIRQTLEEIWGDDRKSLNCFEQTVGKNINLMSILLRDQTIEEICGESLYIYIYL